MDHIESHARDDMTIAPVGSHLSFTAAAKFASTPFNPNSSGGGGPGKGLDDSDISMANDDRALEPMPVEAVGDEKQSSIQDQTAPNATEDAANSFRKNLRYIFTVYVCKRISQITHTHAFFDTCML